MKNLSTGPTRANRWHVARGSVPIENALLVAALTAAPRATLTLFGKPRVADFDLAQKGSLLHNIPDVGSACSLPDILKCEIGKFLAIAAIVFSVTQVLGAIIAIVIK